METDPAQAIEHDAGELEERVEKLSAHIDDAKARLEDRAAEAQDLEEAKDVAGDFKQTDDQAGGEDPVGAHEERDEPSEEPS
jgi:predicted  nucleic acid-binding Zn-ribbon protein